MKDKIKKEKIKKEKAAKPKIKKQKKAKSQINQKRILIISIILISAICITYAVILLKKDSESIAYVEQGTIHQEETVVGHILRNEKVIKNEEYQNGIIQIADEGEKVYKNEAIFQYYSDEAKELSNQVEELNFQIQEKLKTEKVNANADIKQIETQIEEKIEELKVLNNVQAIIEHNKTINTLLEKKITMLGETNESSKELKDLIKQRESINKQISDSTKYIAAPISGIVSYRVDGLEEELIAADFDKLTTKYLRDLNLKTGKIIATSGEAGKVIDNFSYYIATTMDSKEAMNAKVGKTVKIRLSTNDEIEAKIAHINEEKNQRVIILKIDRMTEKLTNYRKISFDIIWWSDSGLKVPNEAILKDENGLSYLVRTKSGYISKLLVKILNYNENYAIVSTYNTEELTSLGFTQEAISNYKKVKLYDEIFLNPSLEKLK